MTAAEIRQKLDASVGNVSMALTELRKWGVVKKVWLPGDRRQRFAAEVDVWRMISNVLAARERGLLDSVRERLERVTELLRAARRPGDAHATTRVERAQKLLSLTVTAQTLLESFLATRRFDANPIAAVLALPRALLRRR
jgi:DNA-binding transcriptional regulator GbsR (MarR family)